MNKNAVFYMEILFYLAHFEGRKAAILVDVVRAVLGKSIYVFI